MSFALFVNARLIGEVRGLRWRMTDAPELTAFCVGLELGDAEFGLVGKRVELRIVDGTARESFAVDARLANLVDAAEGFNVHLTDFGEVRGMGALRGLFATPTPPQNTRRGRIA